MCGIKARPVLSKDGLEAVSGLTHEISKRGREGGGEGVLLRT